MAQDSKSRKLDQYIIRFPDGLRERIKKAAEANHRSLNAEIVARLEASFQFPATGVLPDNPPEIQAILDSIVDIVRRDREVMVDQVLSKLDKRIAQPGPPLRPGKRAIDVD